MITSPSVDLVYSTVRRPEAEQFLTHQEGTADADDSVVFGGRACYDSWSRSYPPTAADADYIAHALHEMAHWSIAEHAYWSFYIRGVSRSLTHELVRHRHTSPSQLSQRYVDSSQMDWVCPIEYLDDEQFQYMVGDEFKHAVRTYEDLTIRTALKLPDDLPASEARKRARQSARAVLPNCTETKLVLSGTSRAWFEAMGKRYDPHAEPEIRRLFGEHILPILKDEAPETFRPFELPEVN